MLTGVIDLEYQMEIGLQLDSGGKEEYMWNTVDPLSCLLYYHTP